MKKKNPDSGLVMGSPLIVRNAKKAGGKWGKEERIGGFPFHKVGKGECTSREGTKTSCEA